MEKRFFKTSVQLIIIILFLTNCKQKEKSSIYKINYYTNNIKSVKDSISKMRDYNVKLLTCTLTENDLYNHLRLETPKTPFHVYWNFDYRKINGINTLFIDYKDSIIDNNKKELVKHLIDNNIITFDGKAKLTHPPYYEFVFCKEDISKVKCFGVAPDKKDLKTLKEGEYYYENNFYPKCN